MAFVVEDGTGKTDATSYISVADANTYCTTYGLTAWTGTDGAKEILLQRATQYLDREYWDRLLGTRTNETQALAFPREGLVDLDGYEIALDSIPVQLKAATVETAVKLISSSLEQDYERGGKVQSVSVGPISTTYNQLAPVKTLYQAIENTMKPFLIKTVGIKIERV